MFFEHALADLLEAQRRCRGHEGRMRGVVVLTAFEARSAA